MIGSYYFWKWADNDLPGRPAEVHAALLRGEMHPALQTFDARPLLKKLESAATSGRRRGEQWSMEVSPPGCPQTARFVFVTCPIFNSSQNRIERFQDEFLPLGLSGIEEEYERLIPCMRPKLTQFIPGQYPDATAYDITPDDLPALLGLIVPGQPDAWAELLDQNRGVVAIAEGRRFRVEWREWFDWKTPAVFDQWCAQDRKRLAALDIPYERKLPPKQNPDLLLFADTLRIFEAFLRGEPRPERYHWININDWIEK